MEPSRKMEPTYLAARRPERRVTRHRGLTNVSQRELLVGGVDGRSQDIRARIYFLDVTIAGLSTECLTRTADIRP